MCARRDEPALRNLLLLGQRLDVWRRPPRPGLRLLHVTLRSGLWNMGISELCLRRDHHDDGRMMMPWFAAVAHLLNSPAPAPLLLGPFSFVGSDALSWIPSREACRRGRRSRRRRSAPCQVGKRLQKQNPLGHPQSSNLSSVVAMELAPVHAPRVRRRSRGNQDCTTNGLGTGCSGEASPWASEHRPLWGSRARL